MASVSEPYAELSNQRWTSTMLRQNTFIDKEKIIAFTNV